MIYESTRDAGDPTLPDVSTWEAYGGHFISYAALAFCALMALKQKTTVAMVFVVAAAVSLGAVLEAYQSTLSGRDASVFDGLANLLGAATGAVTVAFLIPRWHQARLKR